MRALFGLRWSHFVRRTLRKADNLKVYLHWQAVVIYLYAGAVFLGGPIYYLLVPTMIPVSIRQMGGMLLMLLLLALLGMAGYRALFAAADGFPSPIPVGDIQFVLTAPISRTAFLGDRLVWGLLQSAGQAALLTPLLWVLGRAFWSPWGWANSLAAGGLYFALQMAVLATGLLLYGLPRPFLTAVRTLRAVLWGLSGLMALVGLYLGRTVRSAAQVALPTLSSLPEAAFPHASGIVLGLLPYAAVWAVVAILLTLLFARPAGEQLAADAVQAERRRAARMGGQSDRDPNSPGLARSSLNGRWAGGLWAVAWRQLAAYRHLPLSAWPTKLLSLLAVAGAPSFLGMLDARGAASVAGGMPLLIPVMIAIGAAAGLMANWRHEIREGLSTRLLPVRSIDIVWGFALLPGLTIGLVASTGLGLSALTGGIAPLAAIPLALAGGALVALLALHEEYLAEVSLTGQMEGRQSGKIASMVLAGAPLLLAYELLPELGPAQTFLFMAVLVGLESYVIAQYLAFRLAADRG